MRSAIYNIIGLESAHAVLLLQVVLETYTGKVAYDPRREDPKLVQLIV